MAIATHPSYAAHRREDPFVTQERCGPAPSACRVLRTMAVRASAVTPSGKTDAYISWLKVPKMSKSVTKAVFYL